MKIYIVLEWWYDGDSNLSQSYIKAFSTHAEAKEYIGGEKFYDIEVEFSNYPDFTQKDLGGEYGDPSFYHIIEQEI